MSDWITDRRPTINDAYRLNVWVMRDGLIDQQHIHMVEYGEPWAPMTPPEPYVKPKRFVVFEHGGFYGVMDSHDCKIVSKCIPTRKAAERIAALY